MSHSYARVGSPSPRWPLRFTRTPRNNLRITYRGVLVAEVFRDIDGYGGGWAEFHPTGTNTADTNCRCLRRWVRQQAQAMDMHIWWGVHVGATEG